MTLARVQLGGRRWARWVWRSNCVVLLVMALAVNYVVRAVILTLVATQRMLTPGIREAAFAICHHGSLLPQSGCRPQRTTGGAFHGRPLQAQTRRLAQLPETLVNQYGMDSTATKANMGNRRKAGKRPRKQNASTHPADELESLIFNQDKIWEYVQERPGAIAKRTAYLSSIAAGIFAAWRKKESNVKAKDGKTDSYKAATLKQTGPNTQRGEALRSGLAEMGVFFVKMGQTLAQRPDLVGDDLAEELKGLQERNAPFPDEVALRIIAEDLDHTGPLAPGVFWEGCDRSGEPLLAELNPRHVASASLGQVYKGRLFDGREVALKVQRPGAREVIGVDWAVAVLACKAYKESTKGLNDYSLIVDTVAEGIRMELDYHNEAAFADEFAERHSFLPFVTSPGWIPEYTGPVGTARVLCLEWYPSRAPSELSREERRQLVEMAVEACVVQLLVTGFVHADPHEGNLRFGDDGRVVFLDFGLMDRVDFGVMEGFAAGIRYVIEKDWVGLTRVMQDVRFTPTPLLKYVPGDATGKGGLAQCSLEEFAEALGKQMEQEEGGMSRFGGMATGLKKMSTTYVMLTPPYVALLCRTFITLEGLLGDDPDMAETFNIYEVALPFALQRVLSPRTQKGRTLLRETLLRERPAGLGNHVEGAVPNWDTLVTLLASAGGSSGGASGSRSSAKSNADDDLYGAATSVQKRLLRTTEGALLRRLFYEVDVYASLGDFLFSSETASLRGQVVESLAARWASKSRIDPKSKGHRRQRLKFGARCSAAAAKWGPWSPKQPCTLPKAALNSSRRAWKVVLHKQLAFCRGKRGRLLYRATLGAAGILVGLAKLAMKAKRRAGELKRDA